jgi:hypothetical protein
MPPASPRQSPETRLPRCPQCRGRLRFVLRSPVLNGSDVSVSGDRDRLRYESAWMCKGCGYRELINESAQGETENGDTAPPPSRR